MKRGHWGGIYSSPMECWGFGFAWVSKSTGVEIPKIPPTDAENSLQVTRRHGDSRACLNGRTDGKRLTETEGVGKEAIETDLILCLTRPWPPFYDSI